MYYYELKVDKDGNPIDATEVLTWTEWFVKNVDCKLVTPSKNGEVVISTTFIGIDHEHRLSGKQSQTTITGGKHDGEKQTYLSRVDALTGHRQWISRIEKEG